MANGYTVIESNDVTLSIQQWLQEQIDRIRGILKPFGYKDPKPLPNPTETPKPTVLGIQARTKQYVNDMPSGVNN
jgi:hypothetical protein